MSRPASSRAGHPAAAALLAAVACVPGCDGEVEGPVLTFPGSALGAEGAVLRSQLRRFMELHPGVRVEQRPTPDAADQRHQLYVQWLNARADDPDILQLDVIWTPEFAAAGWILPLDRFGPEEDAFFETTLAANRGRDGRLYALPWFVDVGMLYWRTDLMEAPPTDLRELARRAEEARASGRVRYGFVLQAARYEGLVASFLEHLVGFGGSILGPDGGVTVDSEAAVRALTFLRDGIHRDGFIPGAALTWHEEETRFTFQNGEALFMRNWPYAYPLMQDTAESRVAGRFAVAAMPGTPAGRPAATLGGSQLAINANTEHPELAWALVEFLTHPARMRERARAVGQYPTRRALYRDGTLEGALPIPPDRIASIIEKAVPRPVTPVYSQLSGILQVELHRALTLQAEPGEALGRAARAMRRLLERARLLEPGTAGEGTGEGKTSGRRAPAGEEATAEAPTTAGRRTAAGSEGS